VIVKELLVRDRSDLSGALACVRAMASSRSCAAAEFQLPPTDDVRELVCQAGGRPVAPSAWQVRVPDWVRFIRRLTPVLDERLAGAAAAGLSGTTNLVVESRGGLALAVADGRVVGVTPLAAGAEADARFTDEGFVQLVLGYHSVERLMAEGGGTVVRPAVAALLSALFPPLRAFVHEAY
jgi:hypothetical protein